MLMSVVPQLSLVEQKEKHQPHQQHGKQSLGRNARTHRQAKGFWQQARESRGQQGTGRQTEQMLRKTRQQRISQQRGQPHTAHSSNQGAYKNRNQGHGRIID